MTEKLDNISIDDRPIGIPDFVKRVRITLGMSKERFAEKLGINSAYVSRVELGRFKLPTAFLRKMKPFLTERQRDWMILAVVDEVMKELNED